MFIEVTTYNHDKISVNTDKITHIKDAHGTDRYSASYIYILERKDPINVMQTRKEVIRLIGEKTDAHSN